MALGKLKFVKRGGAVVATLTADDLAAHEYGQEPGDPLTVIRAEELDLPLKLGVVYINIGQDYGKGFQQSPRVPIGSGSGKVTLTLPIVMDDTKAQQAADVNYFNMRTARTTYALKLSRKHSKLEPTDVINVPNGSLVHGMRITDKDDGKPGILDLKAVREDSTVYTQTGATAGSVAPPAQTVKMPVNTHIEFLDIPLLRDQDNDAGFYVAACGYRSSWSGCVLYKSTDGGQTWTELTRILNAATIGSTLGVLGDFSGGNVFDEANFVDVKLLNGTLSSATATAVMNGANLIILGNEELHFKNAVLIATDTYRLSGFLRGRHGTELAMSTHIAGDRFVLADVNTWRRISASSAEIGLQRHYKAVSFGMTLQQTPAKAFTNTADGLECLSVVEIGAGCDASGNITGNFKRRGRLSAEWRNYADIPLSEATESYEVEIWDSTFTTLKRTLPPLTSKTFQYSAANQTTDFGYIIKALALKIYQLSAIVGRGHTDEKLILLPSGSSTQWRIFIASTPLGTGSVLLYSVEMRGSIGGADLCFGSGGSASASTSSGGDVAANAFDNNPSTRWQSNGATNEWLQFTFLTPVSIRQLRMLVSGSFPNNTPGSWGVRYWSGAAWVDVYIQTSEPAWTATDFDRTYTF